MTKYVHVDPIVKAQVFLRDGERCVACGDPNITFQYRKALGMGGHGKKAPPVTTADGVALCYHHNNEAEGSLRAEALRFGWKLPRNSPLTTEEVPYFDRLTGIWWQPDVTGRRIRVDPAYAAERIAEAA